MKVTITKQRWNFPCKGISKDGEIVVGFSGVGKGTVLETKSTDWPLYMYSDDWLVEEFEPIEEKQPVDWEKVEFPIWAKDRVGRLIQIISIKGVELKYLRISNEAVLISDIFPTQGFAKQWLQSLEILPKGTKIKITI